MSASSWTRLALALVVALVAVAPVAADPLAQLKLLVPANPGGGWDQTGRAMERALRDEKLVAGAVRVTNRGGAGGTIGIAEFAKSKGDGTSLMVMGLVMVGAIQTNKSPVTLESVTPIARLTNEYLVVAVPAQSKLQTLKDFTEALKKYPGGTSIAGGSRGELRSHPGRARGGGRRRAGREGELRGVRRRRRGGGVVARRAGRGGHQRLWRIPGAHRVEEAACDRHQCARARGREARAAAPTTSSPRSSRKRPVSPPPR